MMTSPEPTMRSSDYEEGASGNDNVVCTSSESNGNNAAVTEGNSTITTMNPPPNGNLGDTVDSIGVTLEYQFPEHPPIAESDDNDNRARRSSRGADRRRDRGGRSGGRGDVGIVQFYSKHWFGQFVSGIFTGIVFLSIGIVFVVYFSNLPTYIGVLFILVSFPPCCLAVNRLRHARAQERQRRQNIERLRALRRLHRQARNDDPNRHASLPGVDLPPPTYNNVGFVGNEGELENSELSHSSSMSSLDEADLPSYEEAIRLKQLLEEELARERQNEDVPDAIIPSSSSQSHDD